MRVCELLCPDTQNRNDLDGHDFSHRIKTVYKLLRDNGKYHVMSAGKDDLYSNDKKVRAANVVRPMHARRFPSRLRESSPSIDTTRGPL